MEPLFFSIIKCNAVDDLLYITEAEPSACINQGNYHEYVIPLSSKNELRLYLCIKDLDIYIHPLQLNLSDYIFLRKKPTENIVKLINSFKVDDIFCHCLSKQNLIKATNIINEKKKYQGT